MSFMTFLTNGSQMEKIVSPEILTIGHDKSF
jgi:hypothetical protein